jgi:intracellular septation protein
MSETPAEPTRTKSSKGGANALLVDLGPVLLFVIVFNVLLRVPAYKDQAIFIATGVFMIAVVAAIIYCQITRGRIPPVLIVTGVLVTVFGGLTIAFHDATFIQIKVTVVNGFYAAAILGSFLIKQNVWKLLFGHAYNLPDRVWDILALRWAGFFAFMAVLNEFIRQTQSLEFWTNFRPAVFVLVFVFAVANTPLVLKHHQEETNDEKV